jgi:hypothetical protein
MDSMMAQGIFQKWNRNVRNFIRQCVGTNGWR